MSRSKKNSVYENMDTSFVNLGALLRYLQQQDFRGRVVVHMDEYEAEVTLRAGERPQAHEVDRASGREAEGEAALQRLLVRATDPGGRVSVYREGSEEETASQALEPEILDRVELADEEAEDERERTLPDDEMDWAGLLRTSAELIAAVERATLGVGANFDATFRAARLALADDYAFLDPNGGKFEYAANEIELLAGPSPRAFISGLCEALRRVVEKAAAGKRAATVRERVALELAVLARRRRYQLEEFGILSQLDRIAGTRVI